MSDLISYKEITDLCDRLAESLENRKKSNDIISYEVEPLYDDYKIELRIKSYEELPEHVFKLDVLHGARGKDKGYTGMAGE